MIFHSLINRISSSEIGKRIATGAFWSIFGTAVAKAFVLISGIICAHILGIQEYGELGLIRSTINMFVVFGSVGMGVTATKYISEYLKTDKKLVGKICYITTVFALIAAIIISLIIFFAAPKIVDTVANQAKITTEIRIGTIILFATILNGAVNGILVGFEGFKSIALNTLISSIIESVFIIIGAYYYNVMGAIIGYGSGILFLFLLNYRSIRSFFKKNAISITGLTLNLSDFKILYKFSLPAALSSCLVAPVFWVARTLLIKYDGFAQLGIYEAADQWKVIILFIPAALSQIVLPILSSKMGEKNAHDYWKVLRYNLLLNGGIALFLAVIVSCVSPFLIQLYGKDFTNYVPIILLAFSTVFSSLAAVVGIAIVSRAKVWHGLMFNMLWAAIFILLTYLSLKTGYGANGLAASLLISYAIHTFNQMVYLRLTFRKESI